MASLAEILAKKKAQSLQPVSTTVSTIVDTTKADPTPILTATSVPVSQIDKLVNEVNALKEKEPPSLDDLLDAKMMSTEQKILEEAQIVTADIIPRIRQLESLSDMEAENEMKLLKAALMANPEAVALMLPTDVGLLCSTLRRITKEAIIEAASKVKPKKEKKVDAKGIQAMLAEVDDF